MSNRLKKEIRNKHDSLCKNADYTKPIILPCLSFEDYYNIQVQKIKCAMAIAEAKSKRNKKQK